MSVAVVEGDNGAGEYGGLACIMGGGSLTFEGLQRRRAIFDEGVGGPSSAFGSF